jgi:hypothetical protein
VAFARLVKTSCTDNLEIVTFDPRTCLVREF